MHTLIRRGFVALVAIAFFPSPTGCAHVTSVPDSDGHKPAAKSSMFPLRFSSHAFASYCYNTLRCNVVYDHTHFSGRYANQPSPPPSSGNYRQKWHGGYIPWATFPPPVDVKWTSSDGVAHEAQVDLDSIFKNRVALYTVADSEVPDDSWGRRVQVYLEVIDRTINVYTSAFIPTRNEQTPGNKYSHFRNDIILAWTRTY